MAGERLDEGLVFERTEAHLVAFDTLITDKAAMFGQFHLRFEPHGSTPDFYENQKASHSREITSELDGKYRELLERGVGESTLLGQMAKGVRSKLYDGGEQIYPEGKGEDISSEPGITFVELAIASGNRSPETLEALSFAATIGLYKFTRWNAQSSALGKVLGMYEKIAGDNAVVTNDMQAVLTKVEAVLVDSLVGLRLDFTMHRGLRRQKPELTAREESATELLYRLARIKAKVEVARQQRWERNQAAFF